jgi:hypothetical protein
VPDTKGSARDTAFEFNIVLYLTSNHYVYGNGLYQNYRYETLYTPITDVQITGSSCENGVDPPDVSSVVFQKTTGSGITGAIAMATVYLKHGQSITISNLPEGYYYQITEAQSARFENPDIVVTDSAGTTPAYTVNEWQVSQSQVTSDATYVDYRNKIRIIPPTGIVVDYLPFVMMIAFAVCSGILLTIHRCKHGSARGR